MFVDVRKVIACSCYVSVLCLLAACCAFGAERADMQGVLDAVMQFSRPGGNNTEILKNIANSIGSKGVGVPIAVFNPNSWKRTDKVEVQSPFPGEGTDVKLYDTSGQMVVGQNLGDTLYFTASNVPALGYKVYFARRSKRLSLMPVSGKGFDLKNKYINVRVDQKNGAVAQLYDKTVNRQLIPAGQLAALPEIVIADDAHPERVTVKRLTGNTEVVLMENGPARARITFDHYYQKSQINQDIILYDSLPRMDIILIVDWQEIAGKNGASPTVRFSFPLPEGIIDSKVGYWHKFTSEIPPSDINEPHQWIDLSGKNWGVTFCTDFPVFFDVSGGYMNMVLTPDTLKPAGEDAGDASELTVSVYPRNKELNDMDLEHHIIQTEMPLKSCLLKSKKGTLPSIKSFMGLSTDEVMITSAVCNDNSNSIALTLHNISEKPVDAVLKPGMKVSSWSDSDSKKFPITAEGIHLNLSPNSDKVITLAR